MRNDVTLICLMGGSRGSSTVLKKYLASTKILKIEFNVNLDF